MLRYGSILTVALVIYWLSLSGYFVPLILILGALSILFVLYLCYRMDILDFETVPYLQIPATLRYFVWLFIEIFKANLIVVRAVLRPDMVVTPKMVKIKSHHKTDIARAMFANSITLTPGTVSVEMKEDEILVHALLTEMSSPKGFLEMEARAGRAVGEINKDIGS